MNNLLINPRVSLKKISTSEIEIEYKISDQTKRKVVSVVAYPNSVIMSESVTDALIKSDLLPASQKKTISERVDSWWREDKTPEPKAPKEQTKTQPTIVDAPPVEPPAKKSVAPKPAEDPEASIRSRYKELCEDVQLAPELAIKITAQDYKISADEVTKILGLSSAIQTNEASTVAIAEPKEEDLLMEIAPSPPANEPNPFNRVSPEKELNELNVAAPSSGSDELLTTEPAKAEDNSPPAQNPVEGLTPKQQREFLSLSKRAQKVCEQLSETMHFQNRDALIAYLEIEAAKEDPPSHWTIKLLQYASQYNLWSSTSNVAYHVLFVSVEKEILEFICSSEIAKSISLDVCYRLAPLGKTVRNIGKSAQAHNRDYLPADAKEITVNDIKLDVENSLVPKSKEVYGQIIKPQSEIYQTLKASGSSSFSVTQGIVTDVRGTKDKTFYYVTYYDATELPTSRMFEVNLPVPNDFGLDPIRLDNLRGTSARLIVAGVHVLTPPKDPSRYRFENVKVLPEYLLLS